MLVGIFSCYLFLLHLYLGFACYMGGRVFRYVAKAKKKRKKRLKYIKFTRRVSTVVRLRTVAIAIAMGTKLLDLVVGLLSWR
jgi:hypothetical protein